MFTRQTRELSLTEISQRLGVGKSTAHRLLATLESREFVEQNQQNGRYRLGVKTIHIGSNKLNTVNIIDDCHPILVQLSVDTNESAHLSFYSNGQITFVDKVMGANPAVMSSLIGYRLPAYATASGKVFLAHLEREELEKFFSRSELKALTPFTITTHDKMRSVLQSIRERGHGEDQQESDEGLVCFSAPIRDHYNTVVAAMSVSGAASRMNSRREELIRAVKQAAWQASQKCGCLLPPQI